MQYVKVTRTKNNLYFNIKHPYLSNTYFVFSSFPVPIVLLRDYCEISARLFLDPKVSDILPLYSAISAMCLYNTSARLARLLTQVPYAHSGISGISGSAGITGITRCYSSLVWASVARATIGSYEYPETPYTASQCCFGQTYH